MRDRSLPTFVAASFFLATTGACILANKYSLYCAQEEARAAERQTAALVLQRAWRSTTSKVRHSPSEKENSPPTVDDSSSASTTTMMTEAPTDTEEVRVLHQSSTNNNNNDRTVDRNIKLPQSPVPSPTVHKKVRFLIHNNSSTTEEDDEDSVYSRILPISPTRGILQFDDTKRTNFSKTWKQTILFIVFFVSVLLSGCFLKQPSSFAPLTLPQPHSSTSSALTTTAPVIPSKINHWMTKTVSEVTTNSDNNRVQWQSLPMLFFEKL